MAAWRSKLFALRRWYRTTPRRLTWGLVGLMFVLGDRCFPFSNFPMYGDFPDRTYYVYIADEKGNPLPLFTLFGYRTTFLKRVYNRKVSELVKQLEEAGEEIELHLLTPEQLRPAGDATLAWLVESNRRPSRKTAPQVALRLVHVNIEMEDRELVRRPMTVGVYPPARP
ncbi:MAG: hypothetical protein ACR2OZ_21015 [Verrucomicrobiales bacterium]